MKPQYPDEFTELERAVVACALALGMADDANPDVGMGPLPYMLVDRAIEMIGTTKIDIHYQAICHVVSDSRSRR